MNLRRGETSVVPNKSANWNFRLAKFTVLVTSLALCVPPRIGRVVPRYDVVFLFDTIGMCAHLDISKLHWVRSAWWGSVAQVLSFMVDHIKDVYRTCSCEAHDPEMRCTAEINHVLTSVAMIIICLRFGWMIWNPLSVFSR